MKVILMALTGIAASSGLILLALTGHFPTHDQHLVIRSSDLPVHMEQNPTIARGGDAKFNSRLIIDNGFIDPSKSCDHCTKIEYTPGVQKKAGIAYFNNKLDLDGYRRIVFFARGQHGGEILSFMSAGSHSSVSNNLDTFPNIDFAVITKNITLSQSWKRFEVDVSMVSLKDILYPFGFVIYGNQSEIKQVLYIKGVTFDRNVSLKPLTLLHSTVKK